MRNFNNEIKKIISLFDYEFYLVKQDFKKVCTCVNFDTKQAKPSCEKCLGTGFKIIVRKVKGASQDTGLPTTQRSSNNVMVSRSYYILSRYGTERDNLIIDKENVYLVHELQENRSFGGEEIFDKCMAIQKKQDLDVLLENFKKILRKAGKL